MPSTATDRLSGLSTSVAIKPPCRVATTAAITLYGEQTIDGVAVVEGDRVLVKNQTNGWENGIYVAATGSWARAKDFDGNRDVVQGTIVLVRPASTGTLFYEVTTANPIVIGTSSITFEPADPGVETLINNLASTASASVGVGPLGYLPTIAYTAGPGLYLNYLFARSAAEIAAGVTPTNYRYPQCDVRRYGGLFDNSHDDTTAWQNAVLVAEQSTDPATYGSNSPAAGIGTVFAPSGYSRVSDAIAITKSILIQGADVAEFSAGTRVVQITANKDIFRVVPIAQGCSFQVRDITLLSNTSGTGHLIHVMRSATPSSCNSQRYVNVVFGTPQSQALCIEAGDDIIVDNCLFDVSAAGGIYLGTSTAADVVSDIRISNCDFFGFTTRCILLQNVVGMVVSNCHVSNTGSNRTPFFIDGYTLAPYQLRDIQINGGTFGLGSNTSGVDCLVKATAVVGLSINGIQAVNAGPGAGATNSFIELTGTCSNININNNKVSGAFDTKHFYTDSGGGGAVTNANISGNTFVCTSGAGSAIDCASTTASVIRDNTLIGFAAACVGGKFTSTGSAFNPANPINATSVSTVTYTVNGARVGDKCTLTPTSGTWPLGAQIFADPFISAANTLSVRYSNPTAGNIAQATHDWVIEVSR